MSDFVHFSTLIPRAIAKYKMTRETRAAQICQRFREFAPNVVGKDVLDYAKPKFFKGSTLYVEVPDSAMAQRIYVHRHDLIMKLNLDMDSDWVHEIRVVVGQ